MTERAPPTTKSAPEAAELLRKALAGHTGDLTIADAAAKAGIPLREAELGLHHLSSTLRGTLSATENGELLFRFPYGFTLPVTKRPGFLRFVDKAKSVLLGAGRFVLRAWISIAMVGYALVFLAIGIALATREDERGGAIVGGVLRLLSEALWWTFHPFSPVARRNIYDGSLFDERAVRRRRNPDADVPFYERVNRFVFGPQPEKVDATELEKRLLQHIRANQGRIGVTDLLRLTGLPREEADPLMSRLMLDYEGEVHVDEDGAIFWSFTALRKTADAQPRGLGKKVAALWKKATVAPVTGNAAGTNLLIGALNGFNLVMSTIAISAGLTVERVMWLLENMNQRLPPGVVLTPPPVDGWPVALGLVPLVFSLAIYAMPLFRTLTQGRRARAVAEENARRAVLTSVLDQVEKQRPIDDEHIKRVWQQETGSVPSDSAIARTVAALGGDVDLREAERSGRAAYRFRDLEAEVRALDRERAHANAQEEDVGAVVYRSN